MSKKAVDKSVANGFSRDEHIEASQAHRKAILQVHRFIKDIEVNGKEANALIALFEKNAREKQNLYNRVRKLRIYPLSTQAKSAGAAVKAQSAAATPTEAAPIAKTDGHSIAQ